MHREISTLDGIRHVAQQAVGKEGRLLFLHTISCSFLLKAQDFFGSDLQQHSVVVDVGEGNHSRVYLRGQAAVLLPELQVRGIEAGMQTEILVRDGARPSGLCRVSSQLVLTITLNQLFSCYSP